MYIFLYCIFTIQIKYYTIRNKLQRKSIFNYIICTYFILESLIKSNKNKWKEIF